MKKRITSLLLALVMVLSLVPFTALATEPETVYISVSDDAAFYSGLSGEPLAFTAVALEDLKSIDLNEYGLGDYAYDADGDGSDEITALHLYIYTHTVLLGRDWDEVYVTGAAGSLYFANALFGFSDENLRYDYNGAYPAVDGWGLTADRIVLKDGDFLNVAHYTSWAFWGDSATGFHYFADTAGTLLHDVAVESGAALQLQLVRSYSDWMNGGITAFAGEAGIEVFYGTSYGTAEGSAATGADGNITLTLPEGKWYVWADGAVGMENPADIVSAPALVRVTVKENADKTAAKAVSEQIAAIGTVTLSSAEAIAAARTAYDALTGEQKALVTNLDVLTAAEAALAALQDKAAADAAAAKIGAIGTVTAFSASRISAARTAYDALTGEQKALVTNLDALTAAEAALAAIYAEASQADHKAIYDATGRYLSQLGTPTVGSVGGEWMVIDLVRAGYPCPAGYYQNVVDYVKAKINDKEQLHRAKGTDNSRVIVALTAAGYDVTDVAGHDLLFGLTDMTYVKKQGINGPIWALIAFDTHGYEIPTNPDAKEQVSREGLIAYILSKQLDDGGWALSGKVADPDITGMAMQALAPYYNANADVKAAVDRAIACLSAKQHDNGGFGSIDGVCSESCAQVIVALTALGIDPETDPRFVKNGMSVVDAMCLFAVEGGGFAHVPNGGLNGMATEQSQYALCAYFRFKNGQTSLYHMSDVTLSAEVEALIDAIGTVTKESADDIRAAREAYDALPAEEQARMANYDTLTAAEAALEALLAQQPQKPAAPSTGDATPVVWLSALLVMSLCGVAVLLNKKRAR